ncbi:MAG: alpha/beta hydrolase-fold protein [Pyrinomonadaceae bacterium]
MHRSQKRTLRVGVLTLAIFFAAAAAAFAEPVRIKVSVPSSIAGAEYPLSGRLLVFMKKAGKETDGFGVEYDDPNAVWVSGVDVANLAAGQTFEFDPDSLSFPSKFSSAPAGEYQVFALVDRDHSYTYGGPGSGDVYSNVVKAALPASSAIERNLIKSIPERKYPSHPNAKIVEFESPMLSAFWGRPIKLQATVVVPPSYDRSPAQKYPTVYNIHGYCGTHLGNLPGVESFLKMMTDGQRPEMIYVYLNGHNSMGHHVFADSVNNGPWGVALVKEFIPYLEKQFRMDAKSGGRFVTGHSSGGWSSLWVMITHPDFFAGTWSTSPDPVDFRNFTGPDIYAASANAYTRPTAPNTASFG